MIRQRNIEIIRQACIKANPEILELKPGCYVRDFFKGIGIVMAIEKDFSQRDCYDIFLTESDPELIWQQPRSDLEVLGRPIHLVDVLYAHQSVNGAPIGVNQSGRFMVFRESTPMQGRCVFAMTGYEIPGIVEPSPEGVFWNLRSDTLDDQSNECLEFLAKLFSA